MSDRMEFYIPNKEKLAEPYHYQECGLPNVYLYSGVTVEATPYGKMVDIANLAGLHRAIGLSIIERPTPMSGGELRFLRKQMDLTQRALGDIMRVSDQTVANYEKENTADGPADKLMRVVYLLHILPAETRASLVKQMADATKNAGAHLPEVPRRKIVRPWQERPRKAA